MKLTTENHVNDADRQSVCHPTVDEINPVAIFKRKNANTFLLNAIVDVCLRRRHEIIIFWIYQKLLILATSKFNTM